MDSERVEYGRRYIGKVKAKSLTLTKEVLEERQHLELSVTGLQKQIKLGCIKVEELREEKQYLQLYDPIYTCIVLYSVTYK